LPQIVPVQKIEEDFVMSAFTCSNCGFKGQSDDSTFSDTVLCPQCSYLVPLNTDPPLSPKQTASAKNAAETPKSTVRGIVVLALLYTVFLAFLPLAYIYGQTGTPLCLLAFAIYLVIGTVGGFLFLTGMNDPAYLTNWLRLPFKRSTATYAFLPLFVLGLLIAYFTYSP